MGTAADPIEYGHRAPGSAQARGNHSTGGRRLQFRFEMNPRCLHEHGNKHRAVGHSPPRQWTRLGVILSFTLTVLAASCAPMGRTKAHVLAVRAESRSGCPPQVRCELDRLSASLVVVGRHVPSDQGFTLTDSGGTAFLITQDGYFLTAAHCLKAEVGQVESAWHEMADGARALAFARIVWKSDPCDLAILHIPGFRKKRLFRLGDPAGVRIGDRVYALGFAEKYLRAGPWASHCSGVVTGVSSQSAADGHPSCASILHTAPIWHGDSGGPLLNEKFLVVGVHSGGAFAKTSSAHFPDREALYTLITTDRNASHPLPTFVRHPPPTR